MSTAPSSGGSSSNASSPDSTTISITGSTSSATSRKSGGKKQVHHEDLLLRSWRSTAHGVAQVTSKAERVVNIATSTDSTPASKDVAMKDLNDAIIGHLRNHVEWGRSLTYVEAKLEGKAAEMEALQHYIRAYPSLGKKGKLSVNSTTKTS